MFASNGEGSGKREYRVSEGFNGHNGPGHRIDTKGSKGEFTANKKRERLIVLESSPDKWNTEKYVLAEQELKAQIKCNRTL